MKDFSTWWATYQRRNDIGSGFVYDEALAAARAAWQAREVDSNAAETVLRAVVEQIDPRDTTLGLGMYLNACEIIKRTDSKAAARHQAE